MPTILATIVLEYDDFLVIKEDDKYYLIDDEGKNEIWLIRRVKLNLDEFDPSEEDLFDCNVNGIKMHYDVAGETAGYNGEQTEYLYFRL